MMYQKLILTFLIVLLGQALVFSQSRSIQFQSLSFEEGISDNRIAKVLQDHNGYMWFCTRLGIEKYNGSTFKTYHLPKGHIEINDMIQDGQGRIWVATGMGLFFLNSETDAFEPWFPADTGQAQFLSVPMVALLEYTEGQILCSAFNGTIMIVSSEDKSMEVLHKFNVGDAALQNNYGSSLYKDTAGTVWIGTRNGKLIRYRDSSFSEVSLNGNSNRITAIAGDQNNQLWIGTAGKGLFVHNVATKTTIQYSTSSSSATAPNINNNFILDVAVDTNNNVWIGTDGGGLNLYVQADDEFTSFQYNRHTDFPIADNSILDIFLGRDNIIWLGTVHGGASYFKDQIAIRYLPSKDIGTEPLDKQSSRILEASNGDIWFSSGRNGLYRYRPAKGIVPMFLAHPKSNKNQKSSNVLEIYEDNLNRIWIGTFQEGLYVYDVGSDSFSFPEDLSGQGTVFSITSDDEGNIWVGSDTGIRVYSPDLQLKDHYNTQSVEVLNSNIITALYKDVKGDIWAGTILGLYVFKKDTVIAYNAIEGDSSTIGSERILAITEDDDLSILIGTYGDGLNRFLRVQNRFQQIGKKEGLEGNIVYGIAKDADKNIWCSTNMGLSRISPEGTIENYNNLQGVPSFQGGNAIVTRSGYLVMGNNLGLSYFKPSEFQEDAPETPQVYFTKSTILSNMGIREIPIGSNGKDHIDLGPQDDLVSIYFSDSNYWNPKTSHYSYILEGLNQEWQHIGNQRVLTFSNLRPGDYTLKVSAGDNPELEDAWALVKITVHPAFLQKNWVQFSTGLGVFSLVLLLFRWRITIIKSQRERLRALLDAKTVEVKKEQEKVYEKEIALLKMEMDHQSLSRKKLREELDFKMGELTNYTLRNVHKNHLLTKIKEHLLMETKEKVPRKEILKKIIDLISDSSVLDEDWETFYDLFNQIHINFIRNLKAYCPQLTDREIRLCALIKLDFTSQHIAVLFGISLSSVKVARHRLRKKLQIRDDTTYEEFFETLEAAPS